VRGRRFAANGTPLSTEFLVLNAGQGESFPLRPAISGVGSGSGFVVVADDSGEILGRVFSVTGTGAAGAVAAEAVVDAGAGAGVDGAGTTGNGRGASGLWQQ
jgi:hypothetical protein